MKLGKIPPKRRLSAEEIVDAIVQTAEKRRRVSKARATPDDEEGERPVAPQKRGRISHAGEEVTIPQEGEANIAEKGMGKSANVVLEDTCVVDPTEADIATVELTPPKQINPILNKIPSPDTAVTPVPEWISFSPSVPQISRPEDQDVTGSYLTSSMNVHDDVPHEEPSNALRTAPLTSAPISPFQDPDHHDDTIVYPSGLERDAIPIDPVLLADVPNHTRLILHDPLIAVSKFGLLRAQTLISTASSGAISGCQIYCSI